MPIDDPDGSATVSDNANVLVGVDGVLTAGVAGALPKLPPPKPVVGAALNDPAPAVGLLVKLVAAGLGMAVLSPPLLAPFSFSCVRPNAAIPSTAPIAMWNKPAPCSVSGCHWLVT